VAPGNPGMVGLERTSVAPEQIEADLYVIGPEAPLVDGIADRLRAKGGLVFGPGADGARIEGSKAWMKALLADAGVPTAAYGSFDDYQQAAAFLRSLPGPWVVKTDGLAAGKGVLVAHELDEALADLRAKLDGVSFGQAGRRVVIEEGLSGPELSIMAICDGQRAVALAGAQDFKRVGAGDTGPNTGGMGAYSPVPVAPPAVVDEVMERAVLPTLSELRRRGIDYRGVLYAGIMLTPDGPKIIEFNCRFGDPETQVILPRWESDVTELLAAAAAGRLDSVPAPVFGVGAAVTVVLAAPGYPEEPQTGARIQGLGAARSQPGVHVYAAGVALAPDGEGLVTAGGRVLSVTGLGCDLGEARHAAYAAAGRIDWPGLVMRPDIALAASGTGHPISSARLTPTPSSTSTEEEMRA
jgi:phosphoribosylamine--glycine ligase